MSEPENLAELRYNIYLCRMMRQHYQRQGRYGLMVFAEEQIRSAKRRYRDALKSVH